ncbi:hypothetical protein B0H13DRAFT_1970779 [Mycena leptocephala]|nr:hypothetical protein B0H13DRAFT_1970779 [Mycena leptocephala]
MSRTPAQPATRGPPPGQAGAQAEYRHYRAPGPVYYHTPPPGYGPAPAHPAPPDATELLAQRLSATILEGLAAHQAHGDARLNRIETNLQRLSSDLSSTRQDSRAYIAQIADVLQTSHNTQLARLKRLENILGMGPHMKDQKTLLDRFDLLSFAIEELVERVKDPEANLPDGPLHHDMATSPLKRVYTDAGIPPKTPSPKSTSSVAVGSSPSSPRNDYSSSTLVADDNMPDKELPQVDSQEVVDLFGEVVSRPIPKTVFAAASPVTRPLVPADWRYQSPSPQRALSFNPDSSPEGMEAYSVLPNQPPPADGTIASLRQETLGNYFAGPLMSTPVRAISEHPMSPTSSLSPPQSPRQSDENPPSFVERCRSPTPELPNPPPPSDGTIASLRQETLGNYFADPLMSTPVRAISEHPMSPASSLSPPQSPRQSDDNPPSFVERCRSPTPELAELTAPAQQAQVLLQVSSANVPRAPTEEPQSIIQPQSPSADSLREELSVLNMISSQSNPSPAPLRSPEVQPAVPSSVTPSPMLGTQILKNSPPRLTLSIPERRATPTALPRSQRSPSPFRSQSTPPRQSSTYPDPAELSDTFMSPLSPFTPSEVAESPSTSPSPTSPVSRLPKSEVMDIPAPLPQVSPSRPTVSGLRLPPAGVVPVAVAPRAKKRKAKPQEPEVDSTQGPPSKRARLRSEKRDAGPSGSGKQEKGKKKKKKADADVVWPAITQTVPEFAGKFVGCDKDGCDRWYHYTCVGIVPGDSRLEGTFYCPLCIAGHPPPQQAEDSASAEQCSRPGCPVQERFFEPQGIYGRYTKLHSTHGRIFYWLVFWKGFGWNDATWEPEPPSKEAVDEFNRRAAAEGIDLDDDSASVVMLSEADKGGAKNPEG